VRCLLSVLLVLCSMEALAADWVARTKNKAGGDIVLLATKGTCAVGLRMYATNPSGELVLGCWTAGDLHIIVRFDNGTASAYEYSGWEVNHQYKTLKL
jgi:hypothetical protein